MILNIPTTGLPGTDGIPGQEGPRGERGIKVRIVWLIIQQVVNILHNQNRATLVHSEKGGEGAIEVKRASKECQDWMLLVHWEQTAYHCLVAGGGHQR